MHSLCNCRKIKGIQHWLARNLDYQILSKMTCIRASWISSFTVIEISSMCFSVLAVNHPWLRWWFSIKGITHWILLTWWIRWTEHSYLYICKYWIYCILAVLQWHWQEFQNQSFGGIYFSGNMKLLCFNSHVIIWMWLWWLHWRMYIVYNAKILNIEIPCHFKTNWYQLIAGTNDYLLFWA